MAKFVRIMGDDSGDTADITSGRLHTDTEFTGTITVGEVRGTVADGVAPTDNPVLIAGFDGTLTQTVLTDTSGRQMAVGAVASEGSDSGVNPVLIAGSDSTTVVNMRVSSNGFVEVAGPVADGVAFSENPVLIGGQDGTLVQSALTDSSGRFDVTSTISGGMPVDTELPTAAALADTTANPTVPGVGSFPHTWGSSWNRLREPTGDALSAATGMLTPGTMIWDEDLEQWDRLRQATNDALSSGVIASADYVFNGTTWDRSRGNNDIQGLASAARTVSTNSSTFTNYNAKGLAVFLDVTVNAGASETLDLIVQAQDAESSTWYDLTADTPQNYGGGAGTRVHHVYPGIGAAAAGIDVASSVLLPRTYRIRVEHSASGSWTYSVGVSVVL